APAAGGDGRIENRPARARSIRRERTEEPDRAAGGPDDPFRGALGLFDKRTALEEVLGRGAADGELRGQDEVGAFLLPGPALRKDLFGLAAEVSDRRIDLCDGNPDRPLHGFVDFSEDSSVTRIAASILRLVLDQGSPRPAVRRRRRIRRGRREEK